MKRYGQWAGNEAGQAEDPTRCTESVLPAREWISKQCTKKRGHGPDGAYCKQHANKIEKLKALNLKYGFT